MLLTHMHADHLCGLRDAQAARPSRTPPCVAARDAGFWLDEKTAASAPKEMAGLLSGWRARRWRPIARPPAVDLRAGRGAAARRHRDGDERLHARPSAFLFESQAAGCWSGAICAPWCSSRGRRSVSSSTPIRRRRSPPAARFRAGRQPGAGRSPVRTCPFPSLGRLRGRDLPLGAGEFGPLPAATAPSSR